MTFTSLAFSRIVAAHTRVIQKVAGLRLRSSGFCNHSSRCFASLGEVKSVGPVENARGGATARKGATSDQSMRGARVGIFLRTAKTAARDVGRRVRFLLLPRVRLGALARDRKGWRRVVSRDGPHSRARRRPPAPLVARMSPAGGWERGRG